MLVAELFFGRGIKGGGFVTEAEWSRFVTDTVLPSFPDGYTVFDGMGGWRDAETGRAERDPTKILLVAADRAPDLAGRLQNVIDAYKTRFAQKSVGIITRDSCANFQ
jgi:serine/threonine protein phosphatase PrpC